MKTELKITPSSFFENSLQIKAGRGDETFGTLDYSVHPVTGAINLELIVTDTPNTGIGLALLRKFVNEVGPMRQICASITNDRTWEYFEEAGILRLVTAVDRLDIVTPSEIAQVPIAHFLQKGAIDVKKITVQKVKLIEEEGIKTTRDYERVKESWVSRGRNIAAFGNKFFNASLQGTT